MLGHWRVEGDQYRSVVSIGVENRGITYNRLFPFHISHIEMVGAGILPVSRYNKKLYFLLGRENIYERSSPGWADFGGGVEPNQSIWKSAVREAHEESTGMLGTESDIDHQARLDGGVFPITVGTYHTHLMYMPYDPMLPDRYQTNHDLLWTALDSRKLQSSRLFEKDRIQWFTAAELKKKRRTFRVFFRPIIDVILKQAGEIESYVRRAERRCGGQTTRKRKCAVTPWMKKTRKRAVSKQAAVPVAS